MIVIGISYLFLVDGLTSGQEYEFRVKAKNVAGHSLPTASTGPVCVKQKYRMCGWQTAASCIYGCPTDASCMCGCETAASCMCG